MKVQKKLVFSLLGWFLPFFLNGGEISPEKVIRNMEKTINSSKIIRVLFDETYIWKLTGEASSITGELVMQDDDQFRIITDDQTIVSDGDTLWTYSKPSNRVIIDHLTDSDEVLLPRQIFFYYTKDFQVRMKGEEEIRSNDCYTLEFTTKSGDSYIPKVKVWIDKEEWLPRKIEQTDLNNNRTIYLLRDIQIGLEMNNSIFQFIIPDSAEVIKMK
jgi:outer membrane lipoprotein-sorting protein